MGIDENSLYRDLESICTSLLQRVVKIQVGGENAKGRKKWEIFQWVKGKKEWYLNKAKSVIDQYQSEREEKQTSVQKEFVD